MGFRWMDEIQEGRTQGQRVITEEAKHRASDMAQWVMSFATKLRNLSSYVHTQEPQKKRLQKLKLSY